MTLTGDRCRCASCGLYFKSTAAFDKHRTGPFRNGERRCKTYDEMSQAGMAVNAKGYWVTAINPKYRRSA